MTSKKHSGSGDIGDIKDRAVPLLKPDGRFNTVHLLPVLLNSKESSFSLAKPSIFNNEMQMSAEDRIHKLIHTREKVSVKVNKELEHSLSFRFFPKVVVFQNFLPGKVYKVPVSVRNACQIMKPLQITYEESQHFSVSFTSGLFTRIAPGMGTVLMVHFTPEDKKDYSYQISLQSNQECFKVPIFAIGPRPLLDFPDDIHIPSGPIKIRCTKVVLVRNIGDVPAIFSLATSSPFEVEPRKGVLRSSEMMNVRVSVTPKKCGNIQGQLKICYETGEILYSKLYGVGEEANIWMDKSRIQIEETFIGVKQVATVTLHNDSNHLLHFKWKKMETVEDEFAEYDKLMNGFSFMRNLESQKYSKLSKGEVVDPETHTQVYNRMYDDEVRALKNEEFLFNHAHIKLRPLTGDIWPKSSIDIMVIFEPIESGKHSTVAYCDIPGHDKRLPLIISGLVKGPQFAFNLDFLDIDCVFVSKPHCYEVVVKNVGLIPGTIAFQPTRTKYGGKISCSPESLGLMPEESKTFLLTFSSNVQGEFLENILFKVIESDNILKIELKGSVVTPTLKFSVDKIDFGVVPFSFPVSNVILLQNLSMVPVNYKLTMKGDGIEPSISYKQYAAAKEKPRFPKNPKEFTVLPNRGTVEAYSSCKIKITLTGNINREKKSTLVLELLDAISEHVCIPITHTVAFPTIKCSPNDINIRFCFISYPYVRTLVLENKSNVMGFFYIPNPPVYAMGTLMFSAPISHGIIKAGSKIKIPITILTNSLGLQTCTVSMITLGDDSPKEICTLSGCGQGPVMTAEPHHLDYGNVDLLDTVTKEFILTNDSPVPASYSMTLVKKNSPWEVAQRSGILPAEKNIAVDVNIFLRDTGRYKDTLQIDVFGSRTLQVTLAAEGVGTSLVITPAFCPIFDLGYVLTNKIIERNFTITNEGNRHHQITWSPLPTFKEKSSKKDEPEPIVRTLFHIEPDIMQLSGRQSAEFLIRGISEKIQQVSEQFFCHALVAGKRETLLFTKIKANFIDPKVIFSKPEIVFKVEIGPKENYKILYDNVNMTNATDLPYKIVLKTESPFLIMGKNEPVSKISLVLDSLATVELTIIFDTSCITDLYSRKFQNILQVSYREHTHTDHLPLSGEANFPNVNIFPDILDFGCIPSGSGASETFEIVNNGQLPIKYHWYWLPDGNVDYADECRKKESRSLSAISLTNIDEGQDDQTSMSEISLDKPNDEVDLKELKSKKKRRVSKVTDEDIKAMLFPIIAQFFEEETEEQALQSLPTALSDVDRENQYFDIAPWYGELHPFEVQTISAKFSGPEPTIQCGVLACMIEGGPTQVLLVRGEIADLDYSLDKSVVDIGYQIFCMPSLQIIKLTNTGNLPFDFSFDLSRNEVPKNETTCLKVEPSQGYLTSKQFIIIQVDFTPGLIKKINETFTLQVGFLDPVPISLEGWGVIPQLYAFLPRPKSYVTVIDIGYEAVDLLLEEFLINEKKKKKKKKKSEKNDELSLFGRSLSRRELNALARNGWSVVTYEDQYPTVAEIDLTVEKLLAQDHMDSCSYANIKLWAKNQCIPGLIFPPYDIDFGIVLVGTSVSYSALLYNYGPIPVTGSFQFNPRRWMLSEQGFSFKLPTITKLGADQTVSMQIFFNPTRSMYKEKKNDVEFLIYLEIAYGARIPIQVRAIVTLPYLVASVDAIDFETIKCGERKAVTMTLSNEGLVPCVWRCEIKGRRSEGSFTFGFLETMTTLLPHQSVDLSIIFKPFTPGQKETILTILSDSIEKLDIPLTGTAVEPRVTLSDHVLKFDPTLPYPENYIRTFKVKNSGIHPIEFYLPHLDSQIMEEERILRVLCDYYETDHLCLPVRNIGDDLPKEIISFYNKLVGMLKSVDDEGPNGQNVKKKKRRSKNDKPKFPQLGSASQVTSVSPSLVTVASEAPNSSDNIEEALHENMEILRKKLKNNDKNDPVKEANDAVNKTDASLDNESKEGMLLIFHGAPFTDSVFHARRVAKALNLKLMSIDDAVIETAATSSFPEAIKLREKINTLYSEKVPMSFSKSEIKEEMGEYEEEDDMDDFPIDDPVEEMRSKVKFILYGPKKDAQSTSVARGQSRKTEVPSGRASSVPSQQTKRSVQKKGGAVDVTSGTIPGISVEILEEILKKRLALRDCSQGVVIDQLTSMFFESAGVALTSILRAQGFIKYIHCFYFYNTFETYATLFNEEKLAAEEAQKIEMERKMALFETLTVEEAEELSESDQALYWSMMMTKRKEEWNLKKNESKKGKKNKKRSINKPEKKGGKRNSKSQPSPETQSPSDNAKKKEKGKKGEGKGKQKSAVQPEQDSFSVDELAGVHLLFNSFEMEYTDLISIAMHWDKRKGMPNTSVSNKQSNTKGRASRKTTPQGSSIAQRLSAMESGNHSVKVSDSVPESVEDESLVIWVFDCANPDPHKDELLISFLGENEEFISSKPETSPSTKSHPTVVNWCAPKPKLRQKIPGPEEFIFCNFEGDDGADEKMVKKNKIKRKSLKKKAEIDTKPEARKVKTRWILNPGEQAEIKIQFDPHSVGEYMFTYPIEVVGWRKPQHITVQGICDLPRIDMDPEVLFDHIVETKEHDKLYRLTFFLDTQYFDFGSILVTKPKDKRLHHIATSFNITNCSSLTAEVRFSFLDKTYEKVDTFAIEPVLLNIKPFNTDKVTVFAMPRALGTVAETIVCSIKDNPALEQIKICCTGVKVDFEVEPKSISFDHVLVFRKDFRIIKLKNKSLVPVIWHFIGFDDAFLEQFDISSTEGLIMPLDDQDIRIEFFATQVVNSLKRIIKVEVFDEEGRGEAIHTENILIHAESVDVVVDISFSDPRKNYIDFGKAKVRSENLQEFYLKNRGKHDVTFKIETDIPANVNIPNLQKVIYVRPVHGILAPYEKASTLEVICTPTFEVYLYAVPIFKCYLLDGQNIVATIPIQVSISAQWCRYEISPKPDMNFGVIPIGIKKVLPLTIKNIGVWDITYTVNKVGKSVDEDVEKMASDVSPMSNPSKSFAPDGSKGADRKSEKEERSSLIKKRSFRYESSIMRCDQFTILSRSGTVTAGEATTIEVECYVEQEGSFNEMISIDIPDKNMDNPLPDIIELVAVARAPFIDFTSLDSIFEEHYVCETLEDMDCPCDIHNHNIFIKSENKFLFANTCLGTPNVARLKLYNPGLIPCELNSQTRQTPSPSAKALVSSSSKSSEPAFTVKPTKLCIAPYSTEFLEVTFLPPQIGIFNGIVEMNLESSTQKECKFVLQLAGEGCVPIITIIEPQQYASSESSDLIFFPTLLGKKSTQKLKLKNTGSISCYVRLDLNEMDKSMFGIIGNEKTLPLIINESPEDMNSLYLLLTSELVATFEVTFMPTGIGKFSGPINISIDGNPYEKIVVNLVGECYTEDITLELPSIVVPGSRDDEDEDKVYQNTLTFGNCFADSPKHIAFKIFNHSQKSIFRFQFNEDKYVKFVPNIGHVKPNSSKEITATFLSRKPVKVEKNPLECHLEKISFPEGIPEGTSWDSRLTEVHWADIEAEEEVETQDGFEVLETEKIDGLKHKMVEPGAEPSYDAVPDSSFTIPILTSAMVAYTEYSCSIKDYEFPETLMFHSNTCKFTLQNTGAIPLSFNWNVVMDENYPLRVPSDVQTENIESIDTPPNNEASAPGTSESMENYNLPPKTSRTSRNSNIPKKKESSDSSNNGIKDAETSHAGVSKDEPLDRESFGDDDFSLSRSLTNRSQETWLSTEPIPFSVDPPFGTLAPDETLVCTLTFSPMDIFDFKVVVIAMIPHLHPKTEPLKIIVKGRSLLPLCYFKMEESDYITSGRRDLSLPGPLGLSPGIPLHAETRVVEFKVIGISGTYQKELTAINPTDVNYNFYWENVTTPNVDSISMFFCSPMKGIIECDGEVVTICNFIAHDTGTFESFWNFVIPEHDAKYHFLFVSHVSEPSACFLTSHVELCPTVIGLCTSKTTCLISNEDTPLKFYFEQNSLLALGYGTSLEISPMKGKIIPAEDIAIKIQFTPKFPGKFNFHVKCFIKGLKKPLILDVSAECYHVQPVVTYESDKNNIITLDPAETNVIELGEVCIRCPQNIIFRVTNIGKTTFYYHWHYDEMFMKRNKMKLAFQSRGGHITSQSRTFCTLTCTFLAKSEITDFLVTLKINKGPDYKIVFRAYSTRPNYTFSSLECNFGLCFFKENNPFVYKKSICIKNMDLTCILIECQFENTPYFALENASGPIEPHEEKEFFVSFSPQGIEKYEEIVEFIINGCTKQKFKIVGEGIDIQVGLQNPQNKLILFAPVLPGGNGFACAPVVNESKSEVAVEFFCGKYDFECHSTLEGETGPSTPNTRTTQAEIGTTIAISPFEITPSSVVFLKPREVINLCVRFRPTVRTKLITEKVYMRILDHTEPLCILEGSCVGPDFSFDRYCVTFGAVLKGCTIQQKLKLINSGEVGARFKWEKGEWNSVFRITPMKGYSSPDTETTFTILFCPSNFDRCIRCMAVCSIDDYPPMRVNLTGACWEEPIAKENILFNVPVRSHEKKTIPIINKSVTPWEISPRLTGQYFYGTDTIHIPPHSTFNYEVTYTPLVMTVGDKTHKGSVVFCIPEGQALAYDLIGTADKPLCSGKIITEIHCKESHTELLPISNWLTTSQRFMISNEVGKFEKFDPVVEISGNEYIDVPGKAEREYKWTVFCYKECTLNVKVVFKNTESKEYLFYELVLKVLKRGPLDIIKFCTPVRQSITRKINLQNPLGSDVNFTLHCSSPEIQCKTPIVVQAYSKSVPINIKYTPLFTGESTISMDLQSFELGNFPYELELKALPPIPENLLKCSTSVGQSATMEAPICNLTKNRAEFSCKIDQGDNHDFETDKQVTLAGNSQGNVIITFEPTTMGNISATLKVSSPTAGEFIFPLLGTASEPMPQGPFSIKMGGSITIAFKNIFNDKQMFTYFVDNPLFTIKASNEGIRPKKDTRIVINFPKNSELSVPVTGKLIVFSTTPALSHIKWIYYLKGVDTN